MHSRRTRAIRALLTAYKVLLSPLFAGSCRFTPSCSEYMAEAIDRHGWLRGSWLGFRRLGRCVPFGGWGIDPVPAPRVADHRESDPSTPFRAGRS